MTWYERYTLIPLVTLASVLSTVGGIGYVAGTWDQQPVRGASGFWAVSCASSTSCVATSSGRGTQVYTYLGGTWHSVTSPAGTDLNWDVACPSRGTCTFTYHGGKAISLLRGRWQQPVTVFTHGGGPILSCTTAQYCVALQNVSPSRTEEANYDGSRWSRPLTVPALHLANSLSGPTPGFCMASNGSNNLAVFTRGRWRTIALSSGVSQGIRWVSCASNRFCAAITTSGHAFIDRGGKWLGPTDLGLVDGPSLSCASGNYCVAVDMSGRSSLYTAGKWQALAEVSHAGLPLVAVSCVPGGFCMAVSDAGYSFRWSASVAKDRMNAQPLIKSPMSTPVTTL